MKRLMSAFFAGLIFALGLGLAGMTKPSKVLGFLDVTGNWDPSLVFVMIGAILTYATGYRLVVRRPRPLCDAPFDIPKPSPIDRPLILGAVLFGIGWGLAGYCPGPAVVGLAQNWIPTSVFVGAMFLGFYLFCLTKNGRR